MRSESWKLPLHCLWTFDAQPSQHNDQLAQRYRGGREQECLTRRVLFSKDVMAVIEVVELLR